VHKETVDLSPGDENLAPHFNYTRPNFSRAMQRHDRDSSTSAELLPVTTPSPNSSLSTLVDAVPIVSPD